VRPAIPAIFDDHEGEVMSVLSNLRLSRKFLVLGAIALLVVAVPTALYLRTATAALSVAEREVEGTKPLMRLLSVVQKVQQHRGLSAGVLGGDLTMEPARLSRRDETRKAVEGLPLLTGQEDAALEGEWTHTKQSWQNLERDVGARALSAADSYRRHTALVAQMLLLVEGVADHYGLTLDPEHDSYWMVTAITSALPGLAEALGQARARGTAALVQGVAPEDRMQLASASDLAARNLQVLRRALERSSRSNAALKTAFGSLPEEAGKATEDALAVLDRGILRAEASTMPAQDYNASFTRSIDAQFKLSDQATQLLQALLEARVRQLYVTELVTLALVVGLGVLATWVAVLIARSVTRPLEQSVAAASAIAEGDLTRTIPAGGGDEAGELLRALARMQDALRRVVERVSHGAESVSTASNQIAVGNCDLSARTEQQASSLEQTAASMDQLSATVKQNAEASRQANQLAAGASAVAEKGGVVTSRVVATMESIHASSIRISEIIGVIDGIAFQTNILALNAAVEAARAGDEGRGFAVVAGEVRSLAKRSADAAKEVKTLINASVEQVEEGRQLVTEAGGTMSEIVHSVKRVADIISEIDGATTEQSAGLGQINQAIGQLDTVTQQNAALVEESAAAAESLTNQAERLLQAVSVFRLDREGCAERLARGRERTQSDVRPATISLRNAA
jgi:methyl-accepting chemotaxis protein